MRNVIANVRDTEHLSRLGERFESDSTAAIAWAVAEFGEEVIVASSFADAVIIDVAVQVAPRIEVLFLDTQYHFAETLWYVEELRKRYDLNLRIERPRAMLDDRWQSDVEGCCNLRKVEPLNRGLAGKRAWITGLRRDDGPTRANTPVVSWDAARSMVKVNPLAAWTDGDVEDYVRRRNLPVNPVTERGMASVGCWPCTRPVGPGEDRRAGRWAGLEKAECGLHLVAPADAAS